MLAETEQLSNTDKDPDDQPLHLLVHLLWPVVREKFPVQMRSAELCHIPPEVNEKGVAYLLRVRELWQERTGEDPAVSETIELLFRGAVENSVPQAVQKRLKQVVGLPTVTYTVWAAHVIHYIDNDLEHQYQEEKDLATLQAQLVKSQVKKMRDDVNLNKSAGKQMTQQMLSQPTSHASAPPLPYGPYPDPPLYPYPPAALKRKPIYNNKRGQRRNSRFGLEQPTLDQCFRCSGFGHWARGCRVYQCSRPQGGTPQYVFDTYPPSPQPQAAPPPSHSQQGNLHYAPGAPQLPQ